MKYILLLKRCVFLLAEANVSPLLKFPKLISHLKAARYAFEKQLKDNVKITLKNKLKIFFKPSN